MASRAAYMREYRARHRVNAVTFSPSGDLFAALARVAELEAEVKHLKAELAKRPNIYAVANQYSTRPFTPVPKK